MTALRDSARLVREAAGKAKRGGFTKVFVPTDDAITAAEVAVRVTAPGLPAQIGRIVSHHCGLCEGCDVRCATCDRQTSAILDLLMKGMS